MPSLEFLRLAIVVTASTHNPSILHPSFLRAEGIVPPDWNPTGDVVSTPAVATVTYNTGITFSVEPAKFQVAGPVEQDETISEVTAKYIEALPKVPYTGVGINPVAFVSMQAPPAFVHSRFVKDGVWQSAEANAEAVGVHFRYRALDSRLVVKLTPAVMRFGTDAERHGIVIEGNYHWAVSSAVDASKAVANCRRAKENFAALTERILFK